MKSLTARVANVYKVLFIGVAAACIASGCATTNADGSCRDYEPLDFCGTDSDYVCDTTDDGCRQCTCKPRRLHRDDEPMHGPTGPRGPY